MKKLIFFKTILPSLFLFYSGLLPAQISNLSKATIIASSKINHPVRETAIRVLQEEVAHRTSINLLLKSKWGNTPVIVLATKKDDAIDGLLVPKRSGENLPETKAEGFRIVLTQSDGKDILWLIGADERGVIFAIGDFLRTAQLSKKKILFNKNDEIETSPTYPIRGHQIGYRNTANSWDSWTPEQYEKYIRELAIFGTNAIENIPFQDGPPGPLMKLPRAEMNLKISQICNKYDLDYWVWTPADVDLSDPVKFAAEVKRHADYYKVTPRLDGVFFPGGDPGNNDPKYVMPFLKAIAAELKKYHPNAGVWISLQGFSDEQVDYFYDYLNQYQPDWLTGVVSGPSSPDIAETRFRLPKKYKHRFYPDITHSVRCQYPALNWDQAFALTEGREICNPQPFYYAQIHNRFAPFTDGFISYSDGSHDDVNKIIWSQMAWNPDQPVQQVLEEYCRFFFGPSVAKPGADGILALERNWVGPIEQNGGIETTFTFWQNLEKTHPELQSNWRWQQLVMRAYYDTYDRRRKIYEEGLEKQANQILAEAPEIGAEKAMNKALAVVNKAYLQRVSPELRQKVFDYCEALWKSIGAQTSVKKYHASGEERGAILDFIDYPLNNRWWLADQFDTIRKMPTEKEKLDRLKIIATWDNPGPGSYYDNISNISQEPHVLTRSDDGTDVAWWDNGLSRKRLSTQLFQNFPVLDYHDLDPNGRYIIRIAGYGDALLRVDGVRIDPIVYNKGLEEFKEFEITQKYVADGELKVTFDQPEESKLNWRNKSKVCDIWLLKQE
ncbi:MAG: hypothetical protein Q8891_06970 [Bacteroidota bacterium]|nr:hypothetical protein [Bacteroidota bacterium]